ncbi:hypothetical protein IPM65_03400 [Candidatus Roizmanbacteria bacterium]|nr:MAG: hypothetical protein IPM65_03400 [Candidatus Roizmanbacteria bacterium]
MDTDTAAYTYGGYTEITNASGDSVGQMVVTNPQLEDIPLVITPMWRQVQCLRLLY